MLVWRPSWISVHCVALRFFVIIFFEFLIPKNPGVDTKMNFQGHFFESYDQSWIFHVCLAAILNFCSL